MTLLKLAALASSQNLFTLFEGLYFLLKCFDTFFVETSLVAKLQSLPYANSPPLSDPLLFIIPIDICPPHLTPN